MQLELLDATICAGNSNVCNICHSFKNVISRNVHNFDLDLYNDQMQICESKGHMRVPICWQWQWFCHPYTFAR